MYREDHCVTFEFPDRGIAGFRYLQMALAVKRFFRLDGSFSDPWQIESFFYFWRMDWDLNKLLYLHYIKSWLCPPLQHLLIPGNNGFRLVKCPTISSSLPSAYQRIILYKTIHWNYLTPTKMHHWDNTNSDLCTRCKTGTGEIWSTFYVDAQNYTAIGRWYLKYWHESYRLYWQHHLVLQFFTWYRTPLYWQKRNWSFFT